MHRSILYISLIAICVSGCVVSRVPPKDPRQNSVGAKDYFFYSCVREYIQQNSIKPFDGSVEYGVEYSYLSSKDLISIGNAASEFASKIKSPNYEDLEHGRPAVLVLCEIESEKWETPNKFKNVNAHCVRSDAAKTRRPF